MIVPSRRLLFWMAVALLPAAVVGGAMPGLALPAVLAMALFLLAVALDAALAIGALDDLEAEFPEVIRLTKDRPGAIALRLRNPAAKERHVRIGLPFPRAIEPEEDILDVLLPAEGEYATLEWPCTPRRRGRYLLDACYIEGDSRMGFWNIRSSSPARGEVRVYPNLLPERKSLAALFLNRGGIGIHAQRQVGRGRDFEKLREYIPGDNYEDIHWKASAKRARPVTKIYQIERTQEVYVILDASRLSARRAENPRDDSATEETSMLERYVSAALVMGQVAERQSDLFGLLAFSDKMRRFLPARNGQAHFGACRDALYTLQPEIVSPDFEELFTFIRLRLRRRALLIFLTSLDDPALAEGFVRHVDLIARQHVVLVNMFRPPGVRPLFSKASSEAEQPTDLDGLYDGLGGHVRWRELRELEKMLHYRGVPLWLLSHDAMCTELVTQYINVKQRQIL